MRSDWRLLLSVTAVATLACTLITSLGLLVTATEQGGVRGALAEIPSARSSIDIRVYYPTGGIDRLRENMDTGVAAVLGDDGRASGVGMVYTEFAPVTELGPTAIGYASELDEVTEHVELIVGKWSEDDGEAVIPSAAAEHFGLGPGSEVRLSEVTMTVVGVYEPIDLEDPYWNLDPLAGKGSIPGFPNPKTSFYDPMDAFGPLVLAEGGLDEAGMQAYFSDVSYALSFDSATVDGLGSLIDRLADGDLTVAQALGNAGASLYVSTEADQAVAAVASGLVVTRSTVIVVSLLLLVLSIAAMAQTARLFTEARATERQLMRSRGAGQGHVLQLAAVEAVGIGIVTAALSPVLALLVYRAFAAQPAMVAAGMPSAAPISSATLATAGAVALVLVVVLLLPLLARQNRPGVLTRSTRQRRGASLVRGGLDIALAVIAAVAFWQLQSYRSVVDDTASLAIDPVLVAGPALVLLAGALLSARLVTPASRLIERVGSRSRSVVVALASWDIGRRSQRATSAVLLLALALAVGSFSLSFLATWRQSQVDQASIAVGAAARVAEPVDGSGAVLRTTGRLSGQAVFGETPSGTAVQVLGLSNAARLQLTEGRVGEEGGARIAQLLSSSAEAATGVTLPGGAGQLGLSVTVDELPGLVAEVRAILEDAEGGLSVLPLGTAPADGTLVELAAALPPGSARLVGVQFGVLAPGTGSTGGFNLETLADIQLSAVTVDGAAVAIPADGWSAVAADRFEKKPVLESQDGALTLRAVVPAAVTESTVEYSIVGWRPVTSVSVVIPADLAEELYVTVNTLLDLSVQGVQVPATVDGMVALVPGSATLAELDAASAGLAADTVSTASVAADGDQLARALLQWGSLGPVATEWWLGSADGAGEDAVTAERVGQRLQDSPLRVATQVSLWLAILAGAVLAAIGFGVHTASTQRARRIELAQLRAIGLPRSGILGLVAAESLLLSVLGAVFGVTIGLLLAALVGPLVAVSPNGEPPVPSVRVVVPWGDIGLLALEVVAVLALIVLVVARVQRTTQPSELLREGGGD